MNKARFVECVKGLGKLYVVYGSFDNQVPALRAAGINSPESVRDASYVRLRGKTQNYTRTCHAPVCAKDSPVIIARISPALSKQGMLKAMVEAHRANQYPVLDSDKSIYREWEAIANQDKRLNPAKRRAIILPQRGEYRIHRDSDEAKFFWQDMRKPYFKEKVNGDSVPAWQIPVNAVDSANGTIVNYIGFGRSGNGSCLVFRLRYLDCSDGEAFGVLRGSAEGALQKTEKVFLYTPAHLKVLRRILHNQGITGDLERRIVDSIKTEQ